MKWYYSLYWRIAAGFVACLALLLVVQATLFVWVVARSGPTIPNQPPDRLAQTIALDIAQAVDRDPTLDVESYLRQEYAADTQPFFVLLSDRRRLEVGGPFPQELLQDAQARLDMLARLDPQRLMRGERPRFDGRGFEPPPWGPAADRGAPPQGGRGGPGPDFDRGRGFGDRGFADRGFGGRGPGFRGFRPAPIVTSGALVGVVVVPPEPRFGFLLRRYAPTLAVAAVATLGMGAALAAFVIFGPARRRLRAVEDAARRLGGGDLTARAPSLGRDEVSAVASAFNAMADDLATRAHALSESDRVRRQLLADVSHELTTPITAMRGYLETLSMPDFPMDEATRHRYLAIIEDETGRLERIVGDLLDLARLEGGGGSLVIGEVPVEQLFARVQARHERTAADAHVTIRSSIAPDAALVRGDASRLEQALQNLAANALRFAPAGTTIDLRAERRDERVVLSVSDHGAGIPSEHLPHIFDRFYKADASRAVRSSGAGAGGSGLGLSIVKAIVERHGGSVVVVSTPGRTMFEIALDGRR
jgi:two-component system, OmpR family, sensor histidine kinase BaeS